MPKIIKMAKGTYTTADITVDSEGRIITASSGSGGSGPLNLLKIAAGPASGNFDTSANSSQVIAYIGGAGGGQGGQNSTGSWAWQQNGGIGGAGGFGFYTAAVTGGSTVAYNVGAGGAGGNPGHDGNAGSAGATSTVTNVGTANAGNGGNGAMAGQNSDGNAGNAGSAPGGTVIPTDITIIDTSNVTAGGTGHPSGNAGKGGIIYVYEQ
jgi:hypothetical protein